MLDVVEVTFDSLPEKLEALIIWGLLADRHLAQTEMQTSLSFTGLSRIPRTSNADSPASIHGYWSRDSVWARDRQALPDPALPWLISYSSTNARSHRGRNVVVNQWLQWVPRVTLFPLLSSVVLVSHLTS